MPFCDWLTLSAMVPGAPIFGGGRVLAIAEDGSVDWETIRHYECKGSHDTTLRIRSDGDRVTLSGNIGRWHRPDNVFGFSVQQCFEIANGVMRDHSLPEFPRNAEISRIDLCENFITGSPDNATRLINYLGGHSVGRMQAQPYGDTGVVWGSTISKDGKRRGSTFRYSKAYAKAPEMVKHNRKGKRDDYLCWLIAWCNFYGLVRFETELKRRYLVRHELNTIDKWSDETTDRVYAEFQNEVMKMSVNVDQYEEIPGRAGEIAVMWRSGVDVWNRMRSTTTRYRIRQTLLAYGIDIKQKPSIERLPIRVRTIELTRAVPPAFYSFDRAA